MHPAPSIIVFSVLSGLGFGLLFWLGLGIPSNTGFSVFGYFFVAFGGAIIGLVASTFHLGNPLRAWRAFTQWRSSWLSREGWCAVLALMLMGLYALALIIFDVRLVLIGILGSILSLATVFTTSMIYAQMKTVPRWNHWTTSALFLTLSIAGGALLAKQVFACIILLIAAAGIQIFVWLKGDKRFKQCGSDIETATQLGFIGRVKLFEAPHTGSNYLLKEMVYQVGRKHASKLRILTLVFMCILPILFLSIFPSNTFIASIAVILHIIGTFASRWLFFAEAEHVVGLYYGKHEIT